jgi:mannose-6-phosphate isomerase-like protein (cupin superfamily)
MTVQSFKVLQSGEGRHFNVFGSTITYKVTAEDTGGAFSLALETTEPHAGIPLHVHHREDEAMYILQGEYEIECGDHLIRVGAGAFVFLPKYVPNRYQNLGDTPGKFLYITSPAGFEKVVEKTSALMGSSGPDMQRVKATAHDHGIDFL